VKTFREEAPLEAWVWRIVLNAALDARRTTDVPFRSELGEVAASRTNGAGSDFARWIAVLPPRQRLAIFLRYEADLDYRSIAHVLDIGVGTVSATLHAAHEALRRSLEEAST
jgi:RNA polymerase sigma factor (sigma-70 family)